MDKKKTLITNEIIQQQLDEKDVNSVNKSIAEIILLNIENPQSAKSFKELMIEFRDNPKDLDSRLFRAAIPIIVSNQEYIKSLKEHEESNNKLLEKLKNYNNLVVSIGYASFFGLWYILRETRFIPDFWFSLAALLVIISLFLYVFSDVFCMHWKVLKEIKNFKQSMVFIFSTFLPTFLGASGLFILGYFLSVFLITGIKY